MISGEEEIQTIEKLEQDELRAQMKLSMYASVTNIIPYFNNLSKICGYIVARDKKVVEKFEFDQSEITSFDTCNDIWKMLEL
ncbi:Unknown protein [Striga hermonthica]|uniref:Uncharacterized protein n=1 Tax=Striga hermonthica TaxID=68872 RepID=A0A9N7P1I8_STRHE|nr:Unknown protein [Striga hermonthica]